MRACPVPNTPMHCENNLGDIGTNGNNGVHGLSPPQDRIMNETFPFHHGAWCGASRNNSHHRTGKAKSFHSSDKYEIIRMGAIFKHDIIFSLKILALAKISKPIFLYMESGGWLTKIMITNLPTPVISLITSNSNDSPGVTLLLLGAFPQNSVVMILLTFLFINTNPAIKNSNKSTRRVSNK